MSESWFLFVFLSVSELHNQNNARCFNATTFSIFKICTKTSACFSILSVNSARIYCLSTNDLVYLKKRIAFFQLNTLILNDSMRREMEISNRLLSFVKLYHAAV